MKDKIKDMLKKDSLIHVFQVVLGIATFVMVLLIFYFPQNLTLLVAAIGCVGIYNILTGYLQMKAGKNLSAAKSMITIGAMIVLIAIIFLFV